MAVADRTPGPPSPGTRGASAAEPEGSAARRSSTRGHWEAFWKGKHAVEEVYSNGDRILRNLQKVTSLKGLRVLEVGAGTGRDSFPLAQCGARVVQLDYSVQSLAILKGLAAEQKIPVEIVGGDTFSLPFRDESFDVVFHQGLLEHFREPAAEKLLNENLRVLRPGGLLLVDVPQRYHVYTVAKRILIAAGRWFAGWERSFTIGGLTRVLEGLGVQPVHLYGEWMVPSFFYRALREALKVVGVRLPLAISLGASASRLRFRVRERLLKTSLPLHTGISIGIIARKKTAA